ncbi:MULTISPECIES: GntR family transcriptional regulator [unclassified Paenibacillus]|uniref:GntR family transcriptional regulator n=1 Tax=unclassified Paenibacillus TaxID=185978 RepID=UPI001AE95600|nr:MULTISPECIES: GntR family transcriptional regulator [unclassified Paenibacillus]MBP1155652.1 DNA-binding GntR family transcriptional regulator [Paenibacillus sp. PvP091]MBP1168962.1 DNA-binding GntR family transcriptional regulator [Paenibacillus sp. PvR098]MBP2439990.1 DNA-binding GntR family transcriptional regulator [Paenibacillus sp. PvP052]
MDSYSVEKPMPYYDQLYHSIKKMIFDGVFKPGERIVESRLAKEMNVSRSPIREAIRALEKEGLVVIDEKSRIIVYKPTVKDVEDIYQCRMALEALAVRVTVQKATDVEMKRIEDSLSLAKAKIKQPNGYDKDEVIRLNEEFHDLIMTFSRNNRLQKQLNDLRSLMFLYRIINFYGEGRDWTIYNEHAEIFSFMKERNEEAASEAMVRHLTADYNHLTQVLSDSDSI